MSISDLSQYTGSDLICKSLVKHGVEHVFLYPGAKNIGILSSLKKSGIQGHLCRHEQGCIFAAEGYAKATNKIGVVLTTSGPGAANTITGIADAYSDSVPILILTAQVSLQSTGTEAFQEMPTTTIVEPITKSCFYIRNTNDISHIFDLAFYTMKHERQRPVLIDIPSNIQNEIGIYHPETIHYKSQQFVADEDIQTFLDLLFMSKKPLICTGGGCKYGHKELNDTFALLGQIPSVSTVMGLGCVNGTSDLFMGLMGMHGLYSANFAINECDLFISLGARFCERATCNAKAFAPNAKIIHIDIDPSEIGRKVKTTLGICCDIKDFLTALNSKLLSVDKDTFETNISEWCNKLRNIKSDYPQSRYANGLNGQTVVYELDKYCKKHSIDPTLTTGVGKHQVFTAQLFQHTNPWKWITSGALACMGFGIPAAIGACLGTNSTVVTIEGDGSILMNIQELATLYNENLPVKIILFNNQILGMVEQLEDEVYKISNHYTFIGDMHDQHTIYPNFNQISEGFSIRNSIVSDVSELENAFHDMFSDDKPYLLNVIIKDSYVRPEIMDGKSFQDTIL